MPAAWPSTLPTALQVSDIGESAPDLVLRTAMDAGPAKVRRRLVAGVRPVSGSIKATAAQAATLDSFYITTLQGGALSFTWTNPRTGAGCTMRFTAPPEYKPLGPRNAGNTHKLSISLKLEILP